jgi:hypothetical protein
MNRTERYLELTSKEILTDSEMSELEKISPSGTFHTGPNLFTIGVKNITSFIKNLNTGVEISRKAFEQGFYIENISLRLQNMEIYLRMYIVVKNKKGKLIDSETDKRTFGNFINDCKNLGFDNDLVNEMKEFNDFRILAIHKYILGEISYNDLREVCLKTKDLDSKVKDYVFNEIFI